MSLRVGVFITKYLGLSFDKAPTLELCFSIFFH